jgi:hypothetical protein
MLVVCASRQTVKAYPFIMKMLKPGKMQFLQLDSGTPA